MDSGEEHASCCYRVVSIINVSKILLLGIGVSIDILLLIFYYFCQLSREVLKFPTVIVNLSLSPFSSIRFCFIYFAAPLVGTYNFRITVPS